jgi:uncharacterized membrane protein YfcA
MTVQYWFIFPIAMASGVGGATFFSPFFILALGLPPEVAIGAGLITEVFGFASGLFAYARKRLIDYRLGLARWWLLSRWRCWAPGSPVGSNPTSSK